MSIDEKSVKIDYTYQSEWIHRLEPLEHWQLYWMQQKIIRRIVSDKSHFLEVGVGSGFTANYLRSKGHEVTTIDIDADKKPDIVTNIVSYEFRTQYDHLLAFEVFEHIPFQEFCAVMKKLTKAIRGFVLLSVPFCEYTLIRARTRLPILKYFEFELNVPKFRITEPNHFWEIGLTSISKREFSDAIGSLGYEILHAQKYLSRYFVVLRYQSH